MFYSLVVLMAAAVIVAVGYRIFYLPLQYGYRRQGKYAVFFKQNLPVEDALAGEPMTFTTRKSHFFALVFLLVIIMIMLVYGLGSTGLVYRAPWLLLLMLFMLVCLTWLAMLTAERHFGTLYLYTNGVIWQSFLQRRQFFFYELSGLRLHAAVMQSGNYGVYEFMRDHRAVLKLPVTTFKDIQFLEQVFTEEHPYVCFVADETRDGGP